MSTIGSWVSGLLEGPAPGKGTTPLGGGTEPGQAALVQAINAGVRNDARLTDLVFYAQHPERNERSIDPQREPNLVEEWVTIRDNAVRPALAAAK